MKDIKIKSLQLNNFKGIKKLQVDLEGNAVIKGDNATGKTTVADAFYWLLFGKDSLGRSDFGIKTYDHKTGETLSGVEHAVTLILDIDGQEKSLAKTYKEKWVKAKGQSKKEFSGHTTEYHIDGVPAKKGEYDQVIKAIIPDENVFKLLTGVNYYNESLHWSKRRELLLQVCGDVTDQQVIDSNDELKDLPDILGAKTAEDYKKQIKAKQKEVNKDLEQIPVRIDEVNNNLPDISKIDDLKTIEAGIKEAEFDIKYQQGKITTAKQGGQAAEINQEIARLYALSNEKVNEVKAKYEQEINTAKNEENDFQDQLVVKEQQYRQGTNDYKNKVIEAENIEKKMQQLRDDWNRANNEHPEINEVCPYCRQDIPAGQIEETKENFNEAKSKRLEDISNAGKGWKQKLDQVEAEAVDLKKQNATLKKELEDLNQAVEAKNKQVAALKDQRDREADTVIRDINDQIEQQQDQLSNQTDTGQVKIHEQAIEALQKQLDHLKQYKGMHDTYKTGQKRITELKQQEKDLAAEYEKLQQELDLCEQFVRSKVNMLEDKINNFFELARFKLFDTYISGGLEETCETLYNGIPYQDLNSGHKIVIGLDIIKTLSRHYELSAPIWIDNAETVSNEYLPAMDSQVIKLVKPEKPTKSLKVVI